MPRQTVTTPNAPSSPLFSQAVKTGPFLILSGMVGSDPVTGKLVGDTIELQVRQALTNCEAVLREAGATPEDIIEVGILLAQPDDFSGLNEEYGRWFPDNPPARYIARLGVEVPGLLVSIRMMAYVN